MFSYLLPGIGMIVVASAALWVGRRLTGVRWRWFGAGAGLWLVAIVLKLLASSATNPALLGYLGARMGTVATAMLGGVLIGIQSGLFEIGITLIAVSIWRGLGSDADRAIAIGIGAGAFEAVLIGLSQLVSTSMALAGVPGTESVLASLDPATLPTLFWLAAPLERTIAILAHAGSRGLVLLGRPHGRPWLVAAGFGLFSLLDSIAAGAQILGVSSGNTLWLVELALLPLAVISVLVLRWLKIRFPGQRSP